MIYEALRDYFAAGGLDVEEHPDQGWLATDGFGQNGSWLLVGQAHDRARRDIPRVLKRLPSLGW